MTAAVYVPRSCGRCGRVSAHEVRPGWWCLDCKSVDRGVYEMHVREVGRWPVATSAFPR